MAKQRLDILLVSNGLVRSRSQAESYIRLGRVEVNSKVVTKPGELIAESARIELNAKEQYVSRAALKLDSVANIFKLSFSNKIILDVGSSTGGFTDYALKHNAKKVYAVEKGTDQLHPSLKGNQKIELFEKTDIKDFYPIQSPDLIIIDVSFISIREILPHLHTIASRNTEVIAMVKPQFEAGLNNLKHKGVIKNDKIRRQILKDFEDYVVKQYVIVNKADSEVAGAKGNVERFYYLKKK